MNINLVNMDQNGTTMCISIIINYLQIHLFVEPVLKFDVISWLHFTCFGSGLSTSVYASIAFKNIRTERNRKDESHLLNLLAQLLNTS